MSSNFYKLKIENVEQRIAFIANFTFCILIQDILNVDRIISSVFNYIKRMNSKQCLFNQVDKNVCINTHTFVHTNNVLLSYAMQFSKWIQICCTVSSSFFSFHLILFVMFFIVIFVSFRRLALFVLCRRVRCVCVCMCVHAI